MLSVGVSVNSESYPGAIGFLTRLLPWVYPVTLIKVCEETGEPVRDHRGLCVRCEAGQLLDKMELTLKMMINKRSE